MNVLFYLGHPAHYHFYKNPIKLLLKKGHKIHILIKTKDILEDLLKNDNLFFTNILTEGRKNNKASIFLALLIRDLRLANFISKNKTDIMVGSEPSLAHIGKLFNIPAIITVEDDTKVIPYFAYLTYPFAKEILTPSSCNLGKWNKKRISYHGYQKLAYLHPNYFKPDIKIVENLNHGKNFFLIRISELSAHHDVGIRGITKHILDKIIKLLKISGDVFISSEKKLEPEFEKYKINIKINDIHHALYFADMLIGDSQSMSVEAAMLGTPSIRFSDFSGKISVLEELEHKYRLTHGIKTSQIEKLFATIQFLLDIPNIKQEYHNRCGRMLRDKIDVTAFLVWFIENYPDSAKLLKINPNYQFVFK